MYKIIETYIHTETVYYDENGEEFDRTVNDDTVLYDVSEKRGVGDE